MLAVLLLSAVGHLVGRGDYAPVPNADPGPGAEISEVERLAALLIAALDRTCPGLKAYADDLTFEGVEDNFSFADGDVQRIGIIYRVADDPEVIPGRFLASGHTCYFELSRDARRLMIAKSACVRVCRASADYDGNFVKVLSGEE